MTAASSLTSGTVSPIFEVSSVTGVGIDLLLKFLHALPPVGAGGESLKDRERHLQEDSEFQVDEIFHIPALGSIVGGRLVKGVIRVGDPLLLGPSETGRFVRVRVQSLHRNRAPCRTVQAGQAATLALGRSYPKSILRKGSVLLKAAEAESSTTPEAASPASLSSSANAGGVFASPPRFFSSSASSGSPLRNATQLGAVRRRSRRRSSTLGTARSSLSPRCSIGDEGYDAPPSLFPFEPSMEEVEEGVASASTSTPQPRACFCFEADIFVLFHPHGIGKNFQATVHIGNIRQTVVIEWIHSSQVIKTGERAVVRFRFIKRPEYVTVGSRLIFREANSKGMGNVTKVIYLGEEAEEVGACSEAAAASAKDEAHAR